MKFSGILKRYLSTATLVIAGTALAIADEATTETENETAVASVIFTEGILDTDTYTLSEDGSSLVIEDAATLTMNSAGTTAVSGTVESSFVVSGGGTVSSADNATLDGIYIGGTTFAAEQTNVSMTVTGTGSSVDLAADDVYIGDMGTVYADAASADVDFTVSDGATVSLSAGDLRVGYNSSSSGTLDTTVSVSGSGSSLSLTSSSEAYIGGNGSSNVTLLAEEGAALTISSSSSLYVARGSGTDVNASVSAKSGGSVTLSSNNTMRLGYTLSAGTGTNCVTFSADGEGSSLTLKNDASGGSIFLGDTLATDSDSSLTASLSVSDSAAATLSADYIILGSQYDPSTAGEITTAVSVTGTGSSLTITSDADGGAICLGYTASETAAAELSVSFSVSDGASATMSADYIAFGVQYSSSSTSSPYIAVSVTGTDSKLTLCGTYIGIGALYYGSGSLNNSTDVSNGATFETSATATVLRNTTLTVGNDSDFDGSNATWRVSGEILVEDDTASATISSGGTFFGESDAVLGAGTLTVTGGELAGTLTIAGGTVALSDNATVSGAVSIVVCDNYLISSASSASARSSALISTVPVGDFLSDVVYLEYLFDAVITSTTGASETVAVSSSDGSITFADTATVTISADADYVQTLVDDLVAGTAVEYNFQLFDADAIAALAEAGVTVELDEIWDTFTEIEATLSLSTGVLTLALAIPEPSSFALLAGTFALALAASRRRRSRKAA